MRRLVVCALVLLATGCGATSFEVSFGGSTGSIESVASDLIEGELSDQIGVALEPDCPEVTDPGVGSTFTCTGTTPDGEVIEFAGVVDREDHIDVTSTNLLLADQLDGWESVAAESVAAEIEVEVTVDCGDRFVVFDASFEMRCSIRDQAGDSADLRITITDLDAGDFRWVIE